MKPQLRQTSRVSVISLSSVRPSQDTQKEKTFLSLIVQKAVKRLRKGWVQIRDFKYLVQSVVLKRIET
ncbi:hypothetical protein D0A37_15295 [Microcoleus vaginatus HSN003]|nr:hypothetical protein D0A37_15295 [Microcoleus vaginatus HSN003]